MTVPLNQALRVGAYVVKQHLIGRKRYPLVLMLEPLFRCNLACAGCGKIDYPAEILNQRLSVAECMEAVDECGAPVVVIAGGEPLLHKEIEQIVQGAIARKKFVIVCTNALLLEKKMDLFQPSKWFSWSVHLDGGRTSTTFRSARTVFTTARSRRSRNRSAGGSARSSMPRCSTPPNRRRSRHSSMT